MKRFKVESVVYVYADTPLDAMPKAAESLAEYAKTGDTRLNCNVEVTETNREGRYAA